MRQPTNRQAGFSHVAILLLFVAVAVIGLVGYRVSQQSDSSQSDSTASAAVPAKIQSAADVRKASKALDNTAIDGSVNPSQLDNDLNSLL